MKILHAAGMNLANVPYLLASNMQTILGDDTVRSWSIYQTSYIKYHEDFLTPMPRNHLTIAKYFLDNGMQDADIYHIHDPYGLPPVLKRRIVKKKKPIYLHYHGSYLRMHGGSRTLANAAKYIFVSTPDLLSYINPEHREKAFFVPNPVSIDPYETCSDDSLGSVKCRESDKIHICHTTTNSTIKGTDYIVKILRFLRDKYDIDFDIIKMKTHWESLQAMKVSDIYLDQFNIGAYGIAAIEAMLMGNVIMAWIDPVVKAYYPECPIKSTQLDNLLDCIKSVLFDWETHKKMKEYRVEWASRFHDPYKLAKYYIDIYSGQEPVRNPRYFLL